MVFSAHNSVDRLPTATLPDPSQKTNRVWSSQHIFVEGCNGLNSACFEPKHKSCFKETFPRNFGSEFYNQFLQTSVKLIFAVQETPSSSVVSFFRMHEERACDSPIPSRGAQNTTALMQTTAGKSGSVVHRVVYLMQNSGRALFLIEKNKKSNRLSNCTREYLIHNRKKPYMLWGTEREYVHIRL